MELLSTIMGIAALALFVLPIVYLQGLQKKKEKILYNDFLQLTKEKGLNLAHGEVWNYVYCLGLDTTSKRLIHFKKRGEVPEIQIIDLRPFKQCSINRIGRTVKTEDGPVLVIDRLNLILSPISALGQTVTIEFYNAEESNTITTELPLVAKWEKQICAVLQA